MFFALQDWFAQNGIWLLLGIGFVVGVGVIWPMSDASYRDRARPLLPARLSHWRAQSRCTPAQSAFLWFGYEPPRRSVEIEAWMRRNASLRVMYLQLSDAFGQDGHDNGVLRADLKRYAARRFEARGERIPAFLRDVSQAEGAAPPASPSV